jgi:glycosyltransferase involved in cell wall biosynthesis
MATLTTVIPAYNAERFIGQTLESVAAQTRLPDRLVILDNCSTDSTPEIIHAFQARHPALNCDYRRNETNIGGVANFNRAFDFARETDFLHVLSADDLIKPRFFETLLPTLEGVQGRGLAHSALEFVDEYGKPVPPLPDPSPGPPRRLTVGQFLRRQSELRHVYCQSVVLRTARQPMAFHFGAEWRMASDVVFFSEWATLCERIVVVPEPLCQYRMHSASATGGAMLQLDAWVLEEWRAMRTVADLMRARGFSRWLHHERQKCIFAARSKVKMQQMKPSHPEYAADIGRAAREITGPLHWTLGVMAVAVRDLLRSHP